MAYLQPQVFLSLLEELGIYQLPAAGPADSLQQLSPAVNISICI